jgi:hypothetical protein
VRFFITFEDTHTHKSPGVTYSGIEVSARDDGGDVFIYIADATGEEAATELTPEQAVELDAWLIEQGNRLIKERDV